MNSFLSKEELLDMGFAYVGDNVLLSRKASIYSPEKIYLHDNCRVDDFVVLSGGKAMHIGRYVHIATHCSVLGQGAVIFDDFSGISCGVRVFSSSDAYDGSFLTNPTVPEEYRKVDTGMVHLGKHVVVGANSVILPGVKISDNVAIGAMSFVKDNVLVPNSIYAGSPLRWIKQRNTEVYKLEQCLIK